MASNFVNFRDLTPSFQEILNFQNYACTLGKILICIWKILIQVL